MSQSITTQIDASTRFALAVLRRHLTDEGTFTPTAIGSIIDHVRTEGTVDGAPYVRPDEIDALTEVLVGGFEPVPYDDPAWDIDEGLWTSDDAIDFPIPDAPDWAITQEPGYRESLAASGIELVSADGSPLPPIAGGADAPFEPTPEDWADYRSWCEAMDRIDACNADRLD